MKKSINIGKLFVLPYDSYSNYINLPVRCLERLSNLHMTDTYFFELKSESKELVYVGVKEFTSPEDCVELPSWMSELLATNFVVNITLIKNIPKGEYIKIEPLEEEFFSLPDNDKLVEYELSKYCLLQLNQIIPMKIFDKVYKFKIIEIKDHDLIDIINIDLNVDFNNKFLKNIVIPDVKPNFDSFFDSNPLLVPLPVPIEYPDREKVRAARLKYFDNIIKKEIVEVVIEPKEAVVEPKEAVVEPKEVVVEPKEAVVVKPKRKYTKRKNLI